MEIPEVRYAKSVDGLHIAYQSFGEGPPVVMIPPLISNVEMAWDQESARTPMEYLARSLRIVHFDKRGVGASDRFDEAPTLEQRVADIDAVMEAEGLDRVHLVASSEGGIMSQLYAERHPERVDKMVLINSVMSRRQYAEAAGHWEEGDEPIVSFADKAAQMGEFVDAWGRDGSPMVAMFLPSFEDDETMVRWVTRFQRQSASPTDMRRQLDSVFNLDGADPSQIRSPLLVMGSKRDRVVPPMASRWLAANVEGARYVEVESPDHAIWFSPHWRVFADATLEFLLDAPIASAVATRRFATILFTDIVSSTERSTSTGDREWHDLKESHDRVAHKVVEGAGGRVVKSTGDGVLATFDVPSAALGAAMALRGELTGLSLPIRAGVHAGEVEVHEDGDVSGVAVNLAARIEGAADEGEILVSSTVRDLSMGSGWTFTERGEHALKGFDGTWSLFALTS